MSFNQQSWGRISGSANNDVITLQNGSYSGAPNVFSYISSTDNLAAIEGANYFLPVFIELNVDDLIYIAGTDGVQLVSVTAVSNISVTVAATIVAGNVTGPSSSSLDHIATFADLTGKVIKDSGLGTGALVYGTNGGGYSVVAIRSGTYAGGGTSNAFTVNGVDSTYTAVATIFSSTNAVSITKAVCGTNNVTVTFSADPGANTRVGIWAWF